jgi:tetratricopeptide (TPR) repeat protein
MADALLAALILSQPLVSYGEDDPSALLKIGKSLEGAGRRGEAATLYERAVSLSPAHVEAWYALGLARCDEAQHDAAASALGAAIRLRPAASGWHATRAFALQAAGRLAEAISSYRRELSASPDDADA